MSSIIMPQKKYMLIVQTTVGQEILEMPSKEEAIEKAEVAIRSGVLRHEADMGTVLIMVGPGTKFIVMESSLVQQQLAAVQGSRMVQEFSKLGSMR